MSEVQAAPPVVNAELAKAIQAATDPEAIRALLAAEAQRTATAAPDPAVAAAEAETARLAAEKIAADKAAADAEAAKTPEKFSRTETIAGKEFIFEGESEADLDRQIVNAYRVAFAVQPEVAVPPAVDVLKEAADAAAAAEAQAAAKAELELKFKRGEITAQDYIEQSGAVKDYLEKQGVPLDELKASIEQSRSKTFEQSWEDASSKFIQQNPDWPGGSQNLQLIGLKIASLGLVDAPDKVSALQQAYASMKADKMLFPPEAPVTAPAAAAATTETAAPAAAPTTAAPAAAAAPAAPAKAASTSSSLFGRSSGAAEVPAGTAPAAAGKTDVPKDATPAELIELWKQGQIAAGKDPNQAFTEAFSSKR